jgi:ferrochelatase
MNSIATAISNGRTDTSFATTPEVGPFLSRLFSDGEIIQLGALQNVLGPIIASRRTGKIEKQYEAIGGSPIRKWTDYQGERMAKRLDELSPETGPHKHYTCFRYADPLTEETLTQMKADGVTRAVAFSQYPHFSCTTTGSSLNHLWRELSRLGMEDDFKWSIIDRWPTHPTFIKAMARRVQLGLDSIPEDIRDKTVVQFSAHSLPMKVVNKGDQYAGEVCATAYAVMKELNFSNPYILCWQSQVGPLPWLGPQTGDALKGFGAQGHKAVLAVPIAFTSDHIETLFEIDIEYKEEAIEAGIEHFARAPSLNEEPLLIEAQAELVAAHLAHGRSVDTKQYQLNCPGCFNQTCRTIVNPVEPFVNMRTAYKAAAEATSK